MEDLSPVYTIQPVVKPVIKPVWQPVKCLYTRYNRWSERLSNQLSIRFDNQLYRVYKNIQPVVKPVWQPVWQPAVSCIQQAVKPVVQPGLTTGWTNSGCSFNTVVYKPNTTTLASSELAPNMFEAGSCHIPLGLYTSWFGASSELAPNMFGASSELASVMKFGREPASSC